MILRRLVEYAHRLEDDNKLTPPAYGEARIRWFVDLDPDGSFLQLTSRGGDAKASRKGETLVVPTLNAWCEL